MAHPDKLPNDVDAGNRLSDCVTFDTIQALDLRGLILLVMVGVKAFAARVFDTLKLSWDAFTNHEKMVKAHLEQQQEEAAQAVAEPN